MRIYISGIKEFLSLRGVELVTEKRRERISAYMREQDKARSLVAGLLLRHACGVTDDSMLAFGEKGKPYLTSGRMHFNISHSGEYVVLALAGREVGVDIEKIRPYPAAVAEKVFTAAEREWLYSQKSDEVFYRLWTAKESIMKASGLGLSMAAGSFCVLPGHVPEAFGALRCDTPGCSANGRAWYLDWLSFDGHMICRAIAESNESTELIIASPTDLLS